MFESYNKIIMAWQPPRIRRKLEVDTILDLWGKLEGRTFYRVGHEIIQYLIY
jgi:hypothetical protein